MPGEGQFRAIPLIADKQAVRVDPFEQAVSSQMGQVPGNVTQQVPGAAQTPSSNPAGGSSAVADATADGELDDAEVAELQNAAAAGDAESLDFLKQLGLPLGVAAATAGAGYLAYQAFKNRGGQGPMPGMAGGGVQPQGGLPANQGAQILNWEEVPRGNPQAAIQQPRQLALPAPTQQGMRGPPTVDSLTAATGGNQNPVGPTLQQMQAETAYAQKAAQDAKAAKRAEETGRAAKAIRLREAAAAMRRIR